MSCYSIKIGYHLIESSPLTYFSMHVNKQCIAYLRRKCIGVRNIDLCSREEGSDNLPVPFRQVIRIFLPSWIIGSSLPSSKPRHFWMASLTVLTEAIQWLRTACFFETGSIIHFSKLPWGENWGSSLLSAFWLSSQPVLQLHLLSRAQQNMSWGCSLIASSSTPPPPVIFREGVFIRNSSVPCWVEGRSQAEKLREN